MIHRLLSFFIMAILITCSSCGGGSSSANGESFRKKFVPPTSLYAVDNGATWWKLRYTRNNFPINEFYPNGIPMTSDKLQLVRDAKERKSFLSDSDMVKLMGRPFLTKRATYNDPSDNENFDCVDWYYTGYRVTFVHTIAANNHNKKFYRAARGIGLTLVFNNIEIH